MKETLLKIMDAEEKAKQLILKARMEAKEIIKNANLEAETVISNLILDGEKDVQNLLDSYKKQADIKSNHAKNQKLNEQLKIISNAKDRYNLAIEVITSEILS